MLTQHHLALIRAALQFFDEELVPHGMKIIRHYLDAPLDQDVTHVEIRGLRSFLEKTELKYGRFNRLTKQMTGDQLEDMITGSHKAAPKKSEVAVVVLIPTRK